MGSGSAAAGGFEEVAARPVSLRIPDGSAAPVRLVDVCQK